MKIREERLARETEPRYNEQKWHTIICRRVAEEREPVCKHEQSLKQ